MNSHRPHHIFFNHHARNGLTTDVQEFLGSHSDFHASPKASRCSSRSISVVPPNYSVDCKSQAKWHDFWWKTRLENYGTDDNPDPVAHDNDFRKTGSVQMLAGTGLLDNEPRVRNIQVDDQTYLFSPIITQRADNDEFPLTWDEADSRYFTKMIIDLINPRTDLFYEVNGKSLVDGAAWEQYRQQSTAAFRYSLPAGGRTADYTVTDGYVVMLNPLLVGTYTIHFGGTINLGDLIVEDLDGDGIIGIPGIPDPTTEQTIAATPEQVTEHYLQLYKSIGTKSVDVTYKVHVTHASMTPKHLDLSALATV